MLNLAMQYALNGFEVTLIDLKGHGLSYGPRCCRWEVQENHDFVGTALKQIRTDKPLFIHAHSMGCMTLQTFLVKNKGNSDLDKIAGIIF